MADIYLPIEAVKRKTKAEKFSTMRKRLDEMGVVYELAWDGEPLVRDPLAREDESDRLEREISQW